MYMFVHIGLKRKIGRAGEMKLSFSFDSIRFPKTKVGIEEELNWSRREANLEPV